MEDGEVLRIDRDSLYREALLRRGLGGLFRGVARAPGGAMVMLSLWVTNEDVRDLLAVERRERRKEADEARAERVRERIEAGEELGRLFEAGGGRIESC